MPQDTITPTLLERVRRNDDRAWDRLLHLFGPLVRTWARAGGVRDGDIDDVVQDVFVKVARSLAGFRRDRAGDTFLGWLRTIARQRVADYHAGKGEAPVGGTAMQQALEQLPAEADEDATDTTARAGLIRRTLELLKGEFEPRTWDAFEGTAVEGRGAGDIAAKLGLSVGAVYVAKSRVLKRLRDELAGLLDIREGDAN